VSERARGMGANVIITETDPVKALQAIMEGYRVMPMRDAAELGDIFITVTGCRDVITTHHFEKMKDGALLANAGHFDVEVNLKELAAMAVSSFQRRKDIMGYKLKNGRTLNVLAEGRLLNLAAGDGHPAEIMDMSFALQALCICELAAIKLPVGVHDVPKHINTRVARLKLAALGVSIDALTDKQQKYITGYDV
jgi:adenosylhomocysteinase